MKTLFTLLFLGLSTLTQAGQLVDVQIIDRSTGRTLDTWRHRGQLYVAGTPGNRYAVRVINKSGGRVLSVISVDGVNAVTGETAHPEQSGYVLATGQQAEVAGWRKSMEEVAAFYFTSVANSYAGRTERPRNVGVIGVAVFREYEAPHLLQRMQEQEAKAESAGAADAAAPTAESARSDNAQRARSQASPAAKLGTGHGERLQARIEYTDFRRASDQAGEIIRIFYDSRANLMARGIIPSPIYSRPTPNPFPGNFAPDPKG